MYGRDQKLVPCQGLLRFVFVALAILLLLSSCAGNRQKKEEYIEQVKATSAAFYSKQAAEAMARGHYDEAITNFKEAAALQPFDPGIQTNLGAAFFRSGRLDSAIYHFEKAITLQPTYARAFIDLGYARLEQKESAAALRAARKVLQMQPGNVDALSLLGKAYQAQNQYELAIQSFQQALELEPDNYDLHLDLGIANNERGEIKKAIEAFRRAADLRPSRSMPFYLLGNSLARLCRLNEAREAYENALRRKPDYVQALNNHGLVMMHLGHHEEALQNFYRALEIDSTASPVLFNLSVALDKIDSPTTALNYISRAIQLDSSFAVFYLQRGNIYMNLGLTDLALASFQKAIDLEPGFALVYNNLGNALLEQNNLKQAEQAYQRALELFPEYLEARYFNQSRNLNLGIGDLFGGCIDATELATNYAMMFNNRGKAKMLLGKLDQAETDLRRAIHLQPRLIQPYENLAYLFQQRGQRQQSKRMLAEARMNEAIALFYSDSLEAALEAVDQALTFHPTSSQAFVLKAKIYHAQKDTTAARKAFLQALYLNNKDATAHSAFGEFLLTEAKTQQAFEHLQRAVELMPNNLPAHEAFARVLDSLGQKKKANQQRAIAHTLRGVQYEGIGQWDRALEEYEAATSRWPTYARAVARKGIVYTKKQLFTEAELLLSHALELNPEEADAQYGMGLLLSETGRLAEAIPFLERAIELRHDYGLAHYTLARCHQQLGQTERASYHLEQAKKLGLIIE